MTVFRAELLRTLALAAALMGLGAAAFAQDAVTAPPRQLGDPAAAPAPQDAAPAEDSTTVPATPLILGHSSASAVTVAPLGSPEGPAAGLLDETNGGFSADIWSGTDRGVAVNLLSRAPVATNEQSLRLLARRLLLTKADAPVGAADHALLTLRVQRLLDAGFIDDAAALAISASMKDDPEFARAEADALLYANRAGEICGDATATRLSSAEPFWIELRAYCYATTSNEDMLDLTRSVMDAQDLRDPAFDTLLDDAVSQKSTSPGEIAAPTALHIFLLRQTGQKIPPAAAHQLGPVASLLAMRDAKNSADERLAAAETAIPTGAVTSEELNVLAGAQGFTPDQLKSALDVAPGMPFLQGQALLRQAALHEADPSRKVQLVFQALQLGEKKNLLTVSATLQQAAAASIKPIRAMRPMADLIGRALMLAGDADNASHWYDILDLNSATDKPLIAKFQTELNLVGTNPARQMQAQQALAYFAKQIPKPDAPTLTADQATAALTLGIYAALGEPMPPNAQAANAQPIQWPGRRPAPIELKRLADSLDQPGRKGEALLTILNTANDPGDLAPDIAIKLVQALIHAGLPDTARAFAIDALLLKPAP